MALTTIREHYPTTLLWLTDSAEAGNFEAIEQRHDFVQLLFPTDIRSQFAHSWAVLSANDAQQWRADAEFLTWAENAVAWMLYFWGLHVAEDGQVYLASQSRFHRYFLEGGAGAHNHRRISRLLRFVRLLDLPQRQALDDFIVWLLPRVGRYVPVNTGDYWLGKRT